MSHQPHIATMLHSSAIILLSIFATQGQSSTNDRIRPENTQLQAVRRNTERGDPKKLPFEETVVISYKVPGNAVGVSSSSNSVVVTPGKNLPAKEFGQPKKLQTSTLVNPLAFPVQSQRRLPGTNNILDLQPVVIYYRTYRPAVIAGAADRQPGNSNAISAATLTPATANSPAMASVNASVQKTVTPSVLPSSISTDRRVDVMQQHRSIDGASAGVPTDDLRSTQNGKLQESIPEIVTPPTEQTANIAGADAPGVLARKSNESADKVADKDRDKIETASDVNTTDSVAPQKKEVAAQGTENIPVSSGAPVTSAVPEQVTKEASNVVPEKDSQSTAADHPNLESVNVPFDAISMNNTAVRLTLDASYTEAKALLEKAIAAEPTMARFHRNLSIVLEKMKKFDEALASARTAAQLAPSDPSVLDQLCELELAQGTAAAALGCFEKLKSIRPLDTVSQAYYGTALFRSGKEEESFPILESAARATPPVAEAFNALGVAYFTKKRLDDAVTAFKNAVEISPDLVEIRFNLAVTELACHNKAAAISQYNLLKSASPELAGKLYRMIYSDKVIYVNDINSRKH